MKLNQNNKNLVLVSGYSGGGKTHTLKFLENCGYYCVDNLPLQLLIPYLDLYFKNSIDYNPNYKVAIGIDVRSTSNFKDISKIIDTLKNNLYNVKIVFMAAEKNILISRFKETRNYHPINLSLELAIDKEIALLNSLRTIADIVIDTSKTNVHELRQHIYSMFLNEDTLNKFLIRFVSFGFSKGIPLDLDTLFDVRFLPNPYFVPELKSYTGLDKEVDNYISKKKVFKDYWQLLINLLDYLIPNYKKEGKSYLSIGVGCTGGRHRSVLLVEKLSKYYLKYGVKVEHRDIYK